MKIEKSGEGIDADWQGKGKRRTPWHCTVQYGTVSIKKRPSIKKKREGNVVVPMSDNGRCQCEAKLCVGKKEKEKDQNPLIGPLHPYLPADSDAK